MQDLRTVLARSSVMTGTLKLELTESMVMENPEHAAQLLAEAPSLTPQEKRLTTIITNNGERVSSIINNVLQLSRRDSTHQERIELNVWLREFLGEFRQTMQIDEQLLRFQLPADEVEVRVDPSHLHQLLWNLCENALKYGRSTQGEPVEIRTGRMATSERPFLEVQDRGPGISTQDAERIFEPFFTAGAGGRRLRPSRRRQILVLIPNYLAICVVKRVRRSHYARSQQMARTVG